jgi:hypothetical protein
MFGFSFKVLAATFCILGISWLALDYFVPSPPRIITIATASKGSSFEYFGQRYRERLARAGVAVELPRPLGQWKTSGFWRIQNPAFISPS